MAKSKGLNMYKMGTGLPSKQSIARVEKRATNAAMKATNTTARKANANLKKLAKPPKIK